MVPAPLFDGDDPLGCEGLPEGDPGGVVPGPVVPELPGCVDVPVPDVPVPPYVPVPVPPEVPVAPLLEPLWPVP